MNNYLVMPGREIKLNEWDPADTADFDGDKDAGKKMANEIIDELAELQELLYAQHKHKVLIILQAFDTGGKDGTIRHVFNGVNPQGVRVANFKVPTEIELDHDYLWRVHANVPAKGEIVIFNRSHYEDVLVVRVHELVPEDIWRNRFDQINCFEKLLVEEGTTILKFFLHIDQKEQNERLLARLDEPDKNWKFNPKDLKERALWSKYQRAYEEAIQKTSTYWAPWYIIPSNRKWYRNLVIASIIVEKLKSLEMTYPQKEDFDLEGYRAMLLEN